MARFLRSRRALAARMLLSIFTVATLLLAIPLASSNFADDPPTTGGGDMDGDNVKDKIEPDPNPPGPVPGEVEIRSGAGGTLLVTIRGQQPNDRFGYSVAVVDKLNLDIHPDLIIGAPKEETGRVYVYEGPFDETLPLIMSVDFAAMTFASPVASGSEYDFGDKVGQVGDIDGDGVQEIRMRAWQPPPPENPQGDPVMRTYIVSGLTGASLLVVNGTVPFDPWAIVPGDADADGDVDQIDHDIVTRFLGSTADVPGAPGSGDVNADGAVDGLDLGLVITNIGAQHFSPLLLAAQPQPCGALPPGYHCAPDCLGANVVLPENMTRWCQPLILCPNQSCWLRVFASASSVLRDHVVRGCPGFGDPGIPPPYPPDDLSCEYLMQANGSSQDFMFCKFNYHDPAAIIDGEIPLVQAGSGHFRWQGQVTLLKAGEAAFYCPSDWQSSGDCDQNPPFVNFYRECCTPSISQNVTLTVDWFANYNGQGAGYVVSTSPTILPSIYLDPHFTPPPAFIEPRFIPLAQSSSFILDQTQFGVPFSSPNGRQTYRHRTTIEIGTCATLIPDPETHTSTETVDILPGDIEEVTATFGSHSQLPVVFTIDDPSVAQFEVNGQYLSQISATTSPQELHILGRAEGTTAIKVRVGSASAEPCLSKPINVGGSIIVEYDRAPTFKVYSGSSLAGGGGFSPPPSPPSGPIVIGGSPFGSNAPDARPPMSQELIGLTNQSDALTCTFRVMVTDRNGNPRKGKAVLLLPLLDHAALTDASVVLTGPDGVVEKVIVANPGLNMAQEVSRVLESLAVVVGDAAERVAGGQIPEIQLQDASEAQKFNEHTFNFHTLKYKRDLAFTGDGYITFAALDLPLLNHSHLQVLRQHLEVQLWPTPNTLEGQVLQLVAPSNPNGPLVPTMVLFEPSVYKPFQNPVIRQQILVPQLTAALQAWYAANQPDVNFTISYSPVVVGDPPGGGVDAITVAAVVAELAFGLTPILPDVFDLAKQYIWTGLLNAEAPNNVVGGIALIGLLADLGYLIPPAGAAMNGCVSVVKTVIKHIDDVSPGLALALFKLAPTFREAIERLMQYAWRVPANQGGVTGLAIKAAGSINQLRRVAFSILNLPGEKIAECVNLLVIRAGRHLTDGGFEGLTAYCKFGNQGVGALDDLFTKIPVSAADDSMESIGEAVGKTYKTDVQNGVLGPVSQQRVDEAIAAARGTYNDHLRAFVTPHIGPSQAFKSMEEFEALRFMQAGGLREEQIIAIRSIRQAMGLPSQGTILAKVIHLSSPSDEVPGAIQMLSENIGTLGGSLTRKADLDGASSTAAVIDRLRLDYNGSPFASSLPHAVIETPMSASLQATTRVPRSPGNPGFANGDLAFERVIDKPYPYIGNGLTASRDGQLVQELHTTAADMMPDQTVIKFKNPDGSPYVVSIGGAGSSDQWILRANPNSPTGVVWEPTQ